MTDRTGVTAESPGTGTRAPAEPADTRQVIRPYGDTTGDGMVQVSFTLPVPAGPRADAAALQLAGKMGLEPASVVHAKPMGPDFTFFIVYGKTRHLIDYASIPAPPGREYPLLTAQEVNLAIRRALNRRLVIVGACIGTDAHTVGIDAILNVKGFAGEKGLEYYREIQVVNMGAQVTVAELVERAKAVDADAVLVSQVVTQRNAHLHNTKQMAAAFHAEYPTAVGPGMGRPLLVVGGPRFDTVTAPDLGVDRIFGRGTTPAEVASFVVHALLPEDAAGKDPS
ncbi:L-beta-lysine 5,6-aminomutase beta subunit [Actinomadura cremea]|nr:L-beta-lysine 5,6-aminomutase beta subunit [Actinomadura cremea]